METKENGIAVSIVCETYNHAPFIRDALEGFLMQKTDFPFEIVVHDDASTDGTADIVREYMERYPGLVRGILQTENQYSRGVYTDLDCLFPQARGRYLAICEGDDYWIDPCKLQKQFDALEAHPEIDICAHGSYEEQDGIRTGKLAPSGEDRIYTTEEIIRGGGGFVATASLMFRRELNESVPRFRRALHNDYTIQIHGSMRGGLLYLKDCMCVYRYLVRGSWTARMNGNTEQKIRHTEKMIGMYRLLDEDTQGRYHGEIENAVRIHEFKLFCDRGDYASAMKGTYRKIFRTRPFRERLRLTVRRFAPFLLTWRESLRKK